MFGMSEGVQWVCHGGMCTFKVKPFVYMLCRQAYRVVVSSPGMQIAAPLHPVDHTYLIMHNGIILDVLLVT